MVTWLVPGEGLGSAVPRHRRQLIVYSVWRRCVVVPAGQGLGKMGLRCRHGGASCFGGVVGVTGEGSSFPARLKRFSAMLTGSGWAMVNNDE